MEELIKGLEIFQKKFKGNFNTSPTLLKPEEYLLRYDLSREELREYRDACKNEDIVEIFDANIDRLFLIIGDVVAHGLQDVLLEGFREVLRSNLSKLDARGEAIINAINGVYDETRPLGKVLKSNLYSKPDLVSVLKYRNINTEDKYLSLLNSGMFFEFHPELSGNWEVDKNTVQKQWT
jgi:hypothetical protein